MKLTDDNLRALRGIRAAADQRRDAESHLAALVVDAVRAGVPALHVADSAGIGRATLYRWLNQEDRR